MSRTVPVAPASNPFRFFPRARLYSLIASSTRAVLLSSGTIQVEEKARYDLLVEALAARGQEGA